MFARTSARRGIFAFERQRLLLSRYIHSPGGGGRKREQLWENAPRARRRARRVIRRELNLRQLRALHFPLLIELCFSSRPASPLKRAYRHCSWKATSRLLPARFIRCTRCIANSAIFSYREYAWGNYQSDVARDVDAFERRGFRTCAALKSGHFRRRLKMSVFGRCSDVAPESALLEGKWVQGLRHWSVPLVARALCARRGLGRI